LQQYWNDISIPIQDDEFVQPERITDMEVKYFMTYCHLSAGRIRITVLVIKVDV